MHGYAKFMHDMVTMKRLVGFEDDDRMEHCSSIATRYIVQNKKYLGAFTIPCTMAITLSTSIMCPWGKHISHGYVYLQEVGFL